MEYNLTPNEILIEIEKIRKTKHLPKDEKIKGLSKFEIDSLPEIPKEWKWVIINDISEFITNGVHTPTSIKDENGHGLHCLRITDLKDNENIDYNSLPYCLRVVEGDYNKKLKKNDIYFSFTGNNLGKRYIVKENREDTVFAHYFVRWHPIIVNPYYIYYITYSKIYDYFIAANKHGSTQPNLKVVDLKRFPIPLCDLKTQYKIAKILKKIDDKIYLNNQINDNLYKVLNTIFREYFCNKQEDENFEKIQLKDLISIRGGLAYKASLLSDNIDDNILVSMGNVELNRIFNFNNLKHYLENVENKYVGQIGDLFICTRDVTQKRNQLGCPGIIPKIFKGKNVIIGTNLYIVNILNNNKNIKYFLYLLMNSNEYRERIVGSAKGTAILMIAKDDILKFEFCFPRDKKVIDVFNNKVIPIFEKIESIIIENDRLSSLRDTLLPKLMNGEIDLDKIEI